MTRFVYITDTHLGAAPMGYQQQPGYPEKLGELAVLLDEWIRRDGIDFVLHGGDMVDQATEANIHRAREVFRLSAPVHLCLGNHDLTAPDARGRWLAAAPEFFPNAAADFSLQCEGCCVHVAPNQWSPTPYCWPSLEQQPHFLAGQIERLHEAVARRPDATHILVTHCPVMPVPTDQTGLDQPIHDPGEQFRGEVQRFLSAHPQVRCVLSGHNHINTHEMRDGVHFITTAAMVETPFEFKLVEATADGLRISTHSLADRLGVETRYEQDKAYVQGRPEDRAFSIPASENRDPPR